MAIPFDESDSQVNVNCVLLGVVFSCSSKLTFFGPLGGERAAFAIAVEIIPWSGFPGSPTSPVSQRT